ncbi:MAG: hypothetical protein KAG98_06125, partial [Lentisphaeria bacterium]|nr:hypothetical protein [Lentisphaeria bacterium]
MKNLVLFTLATLSCAYGAVNANDKAAYAVFNDGAKPFRNEVKVSPVVPSERALPLIIDMVHSNPGEARTVTRFNSHDELKRWGFNAQAAHLQVQCGITFDSFEKGIVPEGSKERLWIDAHAKKIHNYIKAGKKRGIMMIPFTDILVVPKQVYDQYKSKTDNFSIANKVTQRMVRCWINEIFERFPELDGLMLRFGETYLHDTPNHRGKSPVRGLNQHVQLLKILREEVCVKRNKKLIYRTWGWDGFHTNANFFKKATDQVEPHPNLI